ncbi:MAG: hypothetical protein WAK48_00090 [Candidatus Acidiferrum sp.]|jgi:hypothetical protein
MSIGLRATTSTSHRFLSLPLRAVPFLIFVLLAATAGFGRYASANGTDFAFGQQTGQTQQKAEPQPYLEEPLKLLVKQIPELKGIRAAEDRPDLAMILKKTGDEVDEFFNNAIDLVANEEIQQERLGSFGVAVAGESVRDNYLILREGNGARADFDEFRTDENGNRLEQLGIHRGFLVTSGFALICAHLSTAFQPDSTFRILGEEKVGARETYVVVFAQRSHNTNLVVTMTGPSGDVVHMLTQGIAWVDKENFHVVRMRTDLLAPHPEIGLQAQTTKVDFDEVQFVDVATPLWLPRDVSVDVKLGKYVDRPFPVEFRNLHHYTDYRRYRVSTRIVAPQ